MPGSRPGPASDGGRARGAPGAAAVGRHGGRARRAELARTDPAGPGRAGQRRVDAVAATAVGAAAAGHGGRHSGRGQRRPRAPLAAGVRVPPVAAHLGPVRAPGRRAVGVEPVGLHAANPAAAAVRVGGRAHGHAARRRRCCHHHLSAQILPGGGGRRHRVGSDRGRRQPRGPRERRRGSRGPVLGRRRRHRPRPAAAPSGAPARTAPVCVRAMWAVEDCGRCAPDSAASLASTVAPPASTRSRRSWPRCTCERARPTFSVRTTRTPGVSTFWGPTLRPRSSVTCTQTEANAARRCA